MAVRGGRVALMLATLMAHASCGGSSATPNEAPASASASAMNEASEKAGARGSLAAPSPADAPAVPRGNAAPGGGPAGASASSTSRSSGALASSVSQPPGAPAASASRPWPPPAPALRSEWCLESVAALDETTCYVLPDAPTDVLLIYLHGIVPPGGASAQKTNLQTVVAKAARRAGVAALLPRGEQGLGPRGQERWWGWPTGEASYRRRGPALLAAIAAARGRLEALTGTTFARVYLAGSSSGAYFVSGLALHGDLRADGFAAVSGGAPRPTADFAALPRAPFYIGHGTYDPAAASARALGEQLRRAGWPLRVATHPVPHGAHEVYLDEAFAFWREAAAGAPGAAGAAGAASAAGAPGAPGAAEGAARPAPGG